tara:strand:- start:127 stop:306 length:180 start_codon:yes stop_codon:yes gene_type:complete
MAINLRNMTDKGMDNLMDIVRIVDDYPENVIVRLLENISIDEAMELLNGKTNNTEQIRT